MKVFCLQQDLLQALSMVSRSVGVRSTLPVLGNILLATEGDKLKIAATNLEIGVIKLTNAQISEVGEITVPAKTLLEVVQGIGPVKMEMEISGDHLVISAGKFKASLNSIPAVEFPTIPLATSKGITFKKDDLLASSQIIFASAVDEGRPTLTGILTQAKEGILDFVATDGFRLAHRQIKLKDKTVNFTSLIPRRTYEEVLKVITEEQSDDVGVSQTSGQNQIIFTIGQTVISSRLIEGRFPDWEKIIPDKANTRVLVDKVLLQGAIKLAAAFTRSEANIITMEILKDVVVISSEAKELGSQTNEVEAQIEGDSLKIAFNVKFLLEAVSTNPATQLMMELSGPLSPAKLKPVGVEGLEYIIMPVRI